VIGLQGHQQKIVALAVSPDGKRLASASLEAVYVWDMASQTLIERLPGYYGEVQSVAISPNGELLAFGGQDHEVQLLSLKEQTTLTLEDYSGYRGRLAFSPDSKLLAYPTVAEGYPRYGFTVRDTASGASVADVKMDSWALGMAFSTDGAVLATGNYSGEIRLWDTSDWTEIMVLEGHTRSVNRILFSPNGKVLISAGERNRSVRLWEMPSGKALEVLEGGAGDYGVYGIDALAISNDGSTLAYNGPDKTILLWNMQTRKQIGKLSSSDQYFVTALAFSKDGEFLLSSDALTQTFVRVWSINFLTETQSMLVQREDISDFVIDASGSRLVSSSADGTVLLWDIEG
jgi:WD40 repeat protein